MKKIGALSKACLQEFAPMLSFVTVPEGLPEVLET